MKTKPELVCVVGLLFVGALIGANINNKLDFGNWSEITQALTSTLTTCIAWLVYRNWKKPEGYIRYVDLLEQQHTLFTEWFLATYRIYIWASDRIYNVPITESNQLDINGYHEKMVNYLNFTEKHMGFLKIHSTNMESANLISELSFTAIDSKLSRMRISLISLANNIGLENLKTAHNREHKLEILRIELNEISNSYNSTYNKLLE